MTTSIDPQSKGATLPRYRVAVVGVTGYVGAELCRLLAAHPIFELSHALARESRGVKLSSIWPHFTGLIDLECGDLEALTGLASQVDAICFALPHRASAQVIAPLFVGGEPPPCRVLDLSGDFRLPGDKVALYEAHYGQEHVAPQLLDTFVYGLTEWRHDAVRHARAVANPGCFATALNLMLAPLARHGHLPHQVTVFAATGSTGSGKKPGEGTHHPSRHSNYKLYKVLSHQHVPEVLALLESLGGSTKLSFIPASAPMTHGIFATAHLHTRDPAGLARCIASCYEGAPFVRVRSGSPELNHVVGSNFADIGVVCGEQEVVVMCAIDNTLKGASGQAIQNLNLMFDLPETTGLLHAPSLP